MTNLKLWLKIAMMVIFMQWSIMAFGFGKFIDSVCVEGQLSYRQIEALNALEWKKCPGYRDGECKADVGDRVVARECSEFSKRIFRSLR